MRANITLNMPHQQDWHRYLNEIDRETNLIDDDQF